MKKYLSVRIHTMCDYVIKSGKRTYKGYKQQRAHNFRKEKMDADYLLKPERSKDNLYYEPMNKESMEKAWIECKEDYQSYYKKKMPSTAKPWIDGLITFTDTMNEDIEKFGIETLTKLTGQFLNKEFSGGLAALSIHMDETTPHLHFTALNYDHKSHTTYASKMRNEIKAKQRNELQDRYADWMKSRLYQFDYERGEIHSIKEYHNKRLKQQNHLKAQQKQIEQLTKENQELQEKIELKTAIIDKLGKVETEYEDKIEELFNHVYDIFNTNDAAKYLTRLVRYVRNDNRPRLINLMDKMIDVAESKGWSWDGTTMTNMERYESLAAQTRNRGPSRSR